MNKELIMKSDVLDIIFEKRNKAYGAYNLRKFYHNRLTKSLGLMFGAVVILCAFTFLPEKQNYDTRNVDIPKDPTLGQVKPKDPEQKPKPIVAQVKPMEATKFTNHIIIVPRVDSADKLHNIIQQAIGSTTVLAPGSGVPKVGAPIDPGPPGGGEGPITTAPVKPAFDKTQAIANPDVMPEFPGGMDALHRFLQRNLNNPQDLEEGSMVSVKVQFVVGYDGKLQRFHIIEDGGEAFNNEVMRVLKKMPEWKPGKSNGENVSVYYTIPVKFVPAE